MDRIGKLPRYDAAYRSLCMTGRWFPESSRRITTVRDGKQTINFDAFAAQGVARFYTNNHALTGALNRTNHMTAPLGMLISRLHDYYGSGLVWGVSGYTMPDRDYIPEGKIMLALFQRLRQINHQPTAVVTGGVSDGSLGQGGAIAARFQIPTLGYLPLTGLDDMAPLTSIVAHKHSYREREVLVGTTPDVLVCVGGAGVTASGDGKGGTLRECEAALKAGSIVLMLAPRNNYPADSLPMTYRSSPVIKEHSRQFFRCMTEDGLTQILPQILQLTQTTSILSRPARLKQLRAEFT